MQLKKIQTGVVYAAHSTSQYDADRGRPVIVLDTQVWARTNGPSGTTYRRSPHNKPGHSGSWGSRTAYGIPAVEMSGVRHDTATDDQLDTLRAAAKTAADHLAGMTDGSPFTADLPTVGDHAVHLTILQPREVQAEWGSYVTDRVAAAEASVAFRERQQERDEAKATAEASARARVKAVLPDHPIAQERYGRIPAPSITTWAELADLLDAYADASFVRATM